MESNTPSKLNLLVAYPYAKPNLIEALAKHSHKINFLLDSGAFTAWNTGKPITLKSYTQFLDALPFKPWNYFALDVIGDAKGTMDNYRAMLEKGYRPVPVFQPGQSFDDVDTYFETADLIACGGLATKRGNESLRYIKRILQHASGRNVHLLGYTKPKFIKHFKPYSCDSSSWCRVQRFGTCDLYVGNGDYIQFRRQQAINKPTEEQANAITRLGYDVTDFAKEANWRGPKSIAAQASARSWVKYSIELEKKLGTRLFLAIVSVEDVNNLIPHLDYWNERTANKQSYSGLR